MQETKVLAEEIEVANTSEEFTPTPSPTPTATPRPTPESTKTPEPIVSFSPEEINTLVDRFAAQYGVNPHVLRHTAVCESGFNPNAVNGSYVGLYQFGPITWVNYRIKMGEDINTSLRSNAEEAIQTAAFVYSQNSQGIWPNCVP